MSFESIVICGAEQGTEVLREVYGKSLSIKSARASHSWHRVYSARAFLVSQSETRVTETPIRYVFELNSTS